MVLRTGRRKRQLVAFFPHLDGDDEVPSVLEELVRVDGDDAGLVGLRNVGEDGVDHGHEHAVLVWVARVLDDRDHVRALLGHVDEVAAGAVGELDGVHHAGLGGRGGMFK